RIQMQLTQCRFLCYDGTGNLEERTARMAAYIYILECQDGSLYTGITTDPVKRMRQHCGTLAGGAKYTRSHPPRQLRALWETGSYRDAARFEACCKRLSRKEKLRLLESPACWTQLLPALAELEFTPVPTFPLELRPDSP
ncbi:GIY-YIG nuclease family protein, partial [Ruminococcus sp. CAG:330]|uniref:GIY-YIG nuclease family protein n=2 Tax=Oscillospiraceae TaxID=216572 RepID=UPI00263F9590